MQCSLSAWFCLSKQIFDMGILLFVRSDFIPTTLDLWPQLTLLHSGIQLGDLDSQAVYAVLEGVGPRVERVGFIKQLPKNILCMFTWSPRTKRKRLRGTKGVYGYKENSTPHSWKKDAYYHESRLKRGGDAWWVSTTGLNHGGKWLQIQFLISNYTEERAIDCENGQYTLSVSVLPHSLLYLLQWH